MKYYDFKSDMLTQETTLFDYGEFTLCIKEVLDILRRDEFLTIYATKEMITDFLIKVYYPDYICCDELQNNPLNLVDDYYVLSISYDGYITLEPAYINGKLTTAEGSTLVLLDSSCPTKMLLTHEFNEENILIFDFNEDF